MTDTAPTEPSGTAAPEPAGALDPRLAELAAVHGVATQYEDYLDRPVPVSRDAVVAALGALDVPAADDDEVAASLARAEAAPWLRPLPPCLVLRLGEPAQVLVHLPEGEPVELVVQLEDGGAVSVPGPGEPVGRRDGLVRHRVSLPDLPLGWHRLTAQGASPCTLVVAPARLEPPAQRVWGWMVQLYQLRSAGSWGIGDYADLRTAVDSAARHGAGAVLLNPLHAETPVLPVNPSPYSPSSRRFRSLLGVRVAAVPEYTAAERDLQARVDALRPPTDPDRIDRDAVLPALVAALELLWPGHRADELAAFRAERGAALEDFALFCALAEVHGTPWQAWPAPLRRPDGDGVAGARAEHADRVSFWCWVQLLVDEQLSGVGTGLAVGVVHDLAVGVDAGGADAWALQDVLALGTTVGAPPDMLNQRGQDWGLPPWRPDRLAEAGYAPYRSMVQGVLRSAGGLRVDHVMGLFRLWWVPGGRSAAEGTYVSYDAAALLGVLALEAARAGAVVVGEDLGTVEDRVGEALSGAGVLGSDVLWFQTEPDGTFRPPAQWRPAALGTVTTHDLPTAAGFLAGENVRVRHELGQLGHPLATEQERYEKEKAALLAMLDRTGLLARCDGDPVLAMHAALVDSPCRIVLAAYGDAVGDLRQPNLPGTVDEYPNWRLPLTDGDGRVLGLEELLAAPGVRRLTALLAEGV